MKAAAGPGRDVRPAGRPIGRPTGRATASRRLLASSARGVLVLLLLVGASRCASPRPAPTPTETPEELLRGQIRDDSLDPWPHYELAKLYERRGDSARAIQEYGMAINLLPPRSATRPVLDLGVLHHRMGSLAAARRCYEEVLETFPSDTREFRRNPDFRRAALGLKPILIAADAPRELERARERFLNELGGTEEEWERGPPWVTPPRRTAPALSDGLGEGRNTGAD